MKQHRLAMIFVAFLSLLTASQAQTFTTSVLYGFCSQAGCDDGAGPYGGLIQANDGNFYGTTYYGGAHGWGSVYRLSSSGELTTIYSFPGGAGGANPQTSLVQGNDSYLYGTTYFGGPEIGIVFKIALDGNDFKIIYNFCSQSNCADGGAPAGALIQGSDGNFYGTNQSGGAHGWGNLFKVSSAGSYTVLYNFTNGSDGSEPIGGLIEASAGQFYGTAAYGGASGDNGTIFKITAGGTFTPLYSFTDTIDGNGPWATLTEWEDGNFYGTTTGGGSGGGNGTIFKVSPTGTVTTLYSFQGGNDGADPEDQLLLASDGNFYGTNSKRGAASDCGNAGCGTIFQVTPQGNLTTLYLFTDAQNNANPYAGLIEGNDGNLYSAALGPVGTGIVASGSAYTVRVTPGLASPVQFSLSSTNLTVGRPVTASLKVLNAFSLTMQQCYGFQSSKGVTTPLGKIPGTYNSSTKLYTFSTSFTPAATGTYDYSVTCGGVESGFATLTVNPYTTTTTLTASPNPVTPPAGVTLTATVKRTESSVIPTGNVTFYYQATALGSAKLNGNGVATLNASSSGIPAGSYAITAKYSADSSDAASTSVAVDVKVE